MYFLTVVRVFDEYGVVDDHRTIGMSLSYGDLFHTVLNNSVDIYENGYFNYAIISYIPQGLYEECTIQQWFCKSEKGCTIITTDAPKDLDGWLPDIVG